MKKIALMAGVVGLLISCNNKTVETAPAEKETFKFTAAQLSDTKDYVCGMTLDRDDMIADTLLYEGKIYGFCDPGCKTEFLKDPKGYLAQNHQ